MPVKPKLFRLPRKAGLTAEQIHMYSHERMTNFRWISRIMATYSQHILTQEDIISVELSLELSELSQFAEIAYTSLTVEYVFGNLELLLESKFPLEGYDALRSSQLVASIHGKVAKLQAYVAYRALTKQLIVSISGTANMTQVMFDVRTLKHKHPLGNGYYAHTGFWKMYAGIREDVRAAVQKGLRDYDVSELVLTGHSMGGAMSYLLAIDLMSPDSSPLPTGLRMKLAVFGSPRVGNPKLTEYWRVLVQDYRAKNGPDAFKEYSVKAYADGVPALPPKFLGFRHFAAKPFYLIEGRLYSTPESESEYCLFHVEIEDGDAVERMMPFGGHNYHFRDMEKYLRRMDWMQKSMAGHEDSDWQEMYKAKVAGKETRRPQKTADEKVEMIEK